MQVDVGTLVFLIFLIFAFCLYGHLLLKYEKRWINICHLFNKSSQTNEEKIYKEIERLKEKE